MTEHLEKTEMIRWVIISEQEQHSVSTHYLKLQVLFFNKRVQSINLILMRANEERWSKKIMTAQYTEKQITYHSVLGKHPLPGKHPCTPFQGVNVAASIQMYGILIPGKRPCRPKSRVTFKCLWTLTRDTTVHAIYLQYNVQRIIISFYNGYTKWRALQLIWLITFIR